MAWAVQILRTGQAYGGLPTEWKRSTAQWKSTARPALGRGWPPRSLSTASHTSRSADLNPLVIEDELLTGFYVGGIRLPDLQSQCLAIERPVKRVIAAARLVQDQVLSRRGVGSLAANGVWLGLARLPLSPHAIAQFEAKTEAVGLQRAGFIISYAQGVLPCGDRGVSSFWNFLRRRTGGQRIPTLPSAAPELESRPSELGSE